MPLVVSCSCGQRFSAADSLIGKVVRCPVCGSGISVPTAAQTAAADQPGAAVTIRVQCTGCGEAFRAPRHLAGKRVACPQCATPLQVADPVLDVSPHWSENYLADVDSAPAPTAIQRPSTWNSELPQWPRQTQRQSKRVQVDAETIQKLLIICFGGGCLVSGIISTAFGIIQWDGGQAATKAMGLGIAAIVVGGAVLIFLALGGRVR